MLRENLSLVRVDYDTALGSQAWRSLAGAGPGSGEGGRGGTSGWSQADAVQGGVELAILRDSCASWGFARIAEYEGGKLRQVFTCYGRTQITETARAIGGRKNMAAYIFGRGPLASLPPGAGGLPDSWNKDLARACDRILYRLAEASSSAVVPARYVTAADLVAVPLAAIAVIVTGAVVALVGAVATWRYFDPELQRDAVAVEGAARAYTERLASWERTGTMPPASTLETDALSVVQANAKEQNNEGWKVGGLVAGGALVGTLGVGFITKAARA